MDTMGWANAMWDWLYLEHPLKRADVIIGFGSYDRSTAARAAELYLEGWAPWVLFTGSFGKGTLGVFEKPEAEVYADIALQQGVPQDAILIENRATNTGENIRFARELLAERGIIPQRIIGVHKPYMSRRVWAALQRQWPQVEALMAPCGRTLAAHLAAMAAMGVPRDEVLNSLVGDLQRMEAYARQGYQVPQPVPPVVRQAYEALVGAGFDRYVMR